MGGETLKVLLIDDEYPVRNLLKLCIDWRSLGLEISGEAATTDEALRLVEDIAPDILFVDINMPTMNGIGFSRCILDRYPHMRIIILTGYGEFDYARESVKIGVSDFITKPVIAKEIRHSVIKIRDEILKDRSRDAEYERMQSQLEKSIPYLKECFINAILWEPVDLNKLSRLAEELGIYFTENHFQIAVMEAENNSGVYNSQKKEELCVEDIWEHVHTNLQGHTIQSFVYGGSYIILLCNNRDGDLSKVCGTIIQNRAGGYDLSAGVGRVHHGYEGIRHSHTEALKALQHKMIVGRNQVIRYGDILHTDAASDDEKEVDFTQLYLYIKRGNAEKAKEIIHSFWAEQAVPPDLARIRIAAIEIVSTLMDFLRELHIAPEEVLDTGKRPFDRIFCVDTLPEIKMYLYNIIDKTTDYFGRKVVQGEGDSIHDIMTYLDNHYYDSELSLQKVAEDFHLNPSYLSRLFKKKAGIGFVEYLTDIRVKKASQLLCDTDMQINEISEAVGINDPHYMGVCFKRISGMSMMKYRATKGKD